MSSLDQKAEAGQLASNFKLGVVPEARVDPTFPYYASAIKK